MGRAETVIVAGLLCCCAGPPRVKATQGPDPWKTAEGTLESPLTIEPGQVATGDTTGSGAKLGSRCGAGAGGPEVVYCFDLDQQSRVRIELDTQAHDGALHVRAAPGHPDQEVGCSEDAPDRTRSLVSVRLDAGRYLLVVDGSSAAEQGPYSLSFEVAPASGSKGPGDSCGQALGPVTGDTVMTSTFASTDTMTLSCSSSPGGPDTFHSFTLHEDSVVEARVVEADFSSPILGLLAGCTDAGAPCGASRVSATLPAGTHILAVDGFGADQWGDVTIKVVTWSLAHLEARCDAASLLVDGKPSAGDLGGEGDFEASCGAGAPGPEAVHVIGLAERSRVRLTLNSTGFDGVLHLRSRCPEPGAEVGCNDDQGLAGASILDLVLEAGTYWVFVDGRDETASGSYSIEVIVEPKPGA